MIRIHNGFSIKDHIHTITNTEVSQEHKRPLRNTLTDTPAFESAEIEAVVEALDSQGVSTQFSMILGQLYKNIATKISSFYNNINIDVKKPIT